MDLRDPVASVHGVLARQEAGWLLVFDNVPDWALCGGVCTACGARARADHQARTSTGPPGGPLMSQFLILRSPPIPGRSAPAGPRPAHWPGTLPWN